MGPHFGDHRGQNRGAAEGSQRPGEEGSAGERDEMKGTLCQSVAGIQAPGQAPESSYLLNPLLYLCGRNYRRFYSIKGKEKLRNEWTAVSLLPVLETAPPSTQLLLPHSIRWGPPAVPWP